MTIKIWDGDASGGLGSVYVEDSQETNPSPVDAATMREKEREGERDSYMELPYLSTSTYGNAQICSLRVENWLVSDKYPEVLVSGNRDVCAQGV